MRYYKKIEDGYIVAIGTGGGGEEISKEEYDELLALIKAKPTAEEGFDYRLRDDLTWEKYEVPIVEDVDDDEISDEEALSIIMGESI